VEFYLVFCYKGCYEWSSTGYFATKDVLSGVLLGSLLQRMLCVEFYWVFCYKGCYEWSSTGYFATKDALSGVLLGILLQRML